MIGSGLDASTARPDNQHLRVSATPTTMISQNPLRPKWPPWWGPAHTGQTGVSCPLSFSCAWTYLPMRWRAACTAFPVKTPATLMGKVTILPTGTRAKLLHCLLSDCLGEAQ